MERRQEPAHPFEKPIALPPDYLALVRDTFAETFKEALERLAPSGAAPRFHAGGGLFASELVVWVSLIAPNEPAATTVHASVDFDVSADEPTDAEERLAACIDAVGVVFDQLLGAGADRKLRGGALAGLRAMPTAWQPLAVKGRTVHVLADASHPELDAMASELLAKHGVMEDGTDAPHAASSTRPSPRANVMPPHPKKH